MCLRDWRMRRAVESTLSDDEKDDEDEDEDGESDRRSKYAFPELDAQIRAVIARYDAVFPKLNFSSPKVNLAHPFFPVTPAHPGCRTRRGSCLPPLH
jgi:hypothetical protein